MDNIKVISYIASISFQIAGAVILIIKYCGNTKQRVINEYFPGTGIASNDGQDNAVLEVERVRECVINIYANRAAFIFIAIGYLLSIIGDKRDLCDSITILSAFIMTIFLIMLERFLAKLLARYWYRDDIKISYDELPKLSFGGWILGT